MNVTSATTTTTTTTNIINNHAAAVSTAATSTEAADGSDPELELQVLEELMNLDLSEVTTQLDHEKSQLGAEHRQLQAYQEQLNEALALLQGRENAVQEGVTFLQAYQEQRGYLQALVHDRVTVTAQKAPLEAELSEVESHLAALEQQIASLQQPFPAHTPASAPSSFPFQSHQHGHGGNKPNGKTSRASSSPLHTLNLSLGRLNLNGGDLGNGNGGNSGTNANGKVKVFEPAKAKDNANPASAPAPFAPSQHLRPDLPSFTTLATFTPTRKQTGTSEGENGVAKHNTNVVTMEAMAATSYYAEDNGEVEAEIEQTEAGVEALTPPQSQSYQQHAVVVSQQFLSEEDTEALVASAFVGETTPVTLASAGAGDAPTASPFFDEPEPEPNLFALDLGRPPGEEGDALVVAATTSPNNNNTTSKGKGGDAKRGGTGVGVSGTSAPRRTVSAAKALATPL